MEFKEKINSDSSQISHSNNKKMICSIFDLLNINLKSLSHYSSTYQSKLSLTFIVDCEKPRLEVYLKCMRRVDSDLDNDIVVLVNDFIKQHKNMTEDVMYDVNGKHPYNFEWTICRIRILLNVDPDGWNEFKKQFEQFIE